MKIVVFGASGKVGRQVVELLISDGHRVTAFVHQNNPFESNKNLIIAKGNVDNYQDVESAIRGNDIVVSTLGSWGTKNKNVLSSAMTNIIPAMKKQGLKRIISLTGMAKWSNDHLQLKDRLSREVLGTVAPKILNDGDEHISLLDKSSLDWTVVRSPIMTSSPSDKYSLNLITSGLLASIPRAAVARAIVDQINEQKYVKKAAVLHRK